MQVLRHRVGNLLVTLGVHQEKFCSRSCAGRGVPKEKRSQAGRVGGVNRAEQAWQRFMASIEGKTEEEKIQEAYRRGYAIGRRERFRGVRGGVIKKTVANV